MTAEDPSPTAEEPKLLDAAKQMMAVLRAVRDGQAGPWDAIMRSDNGPRLATAWDRLKGAVDAAGVQYSRALGIRLEREGAMTCRCPHCKAEIPSQAPLQLCASCARRCEKHLNEIALNHGSFTILPGVPIPCGSRIDLLGGAAIACQGVAGHGGDHSYQDEKRGLYMSWIF